MVGTTLSVDRLPAVKSACVEAFDVTEEGFDRLCAFRGKAVRTNKAETADLVRTGKSSRQNCARRSRRVGNATA